MLYSKPAGDPDFGDIYDADWVFDAFLRSDATLLSPISLRGGGRGYAPAARDTNYEFVLAHGRPCRAILLTQDCEIDTMIKRGKASRLLMAAVTTWQDQFEAARNFRRHPLPPEGTFDGGVVELAKLFSVAATAVAAADASQRVVRLDGEQRMALDARLNALTARRGPLAILDTAEKIADTVDEARAADVALAVADALAVAWRVEGELRDLSESGGSSEETLGGAIAALDKMIEAASGARAQLAAI